MLLLPVCDSSLPGPVPWSNVPVLLMAASFLFQLGPASHRATWCVVIVVLHADGALEVPSFGCVCCEAVPRGDGSTVPYLGQVCVVLPAFVIALRRPSIVC